MRHLRKGLKPTPEQLEQLAELRELVASRSGDTRRADELIHELAGTSSEQEAEDASDSDQ